jgi:tetratricopeptide (TPR) repeat protein
MAAGFRLGAGPWLVAIVFLATALVSVAVAYDRPAAWPRFALLVTAVMLMVAVSSFGALFGERGIGLAAVASAGAAGLLSLYYLMSFDWGKQGGKLAPLLKIGLWLQARRPALPAPEDIHPNIAGAGLALLIPLGLGGAVWAWRRRRRMLSLLAGAATLLGFATAILTVSRGAWLGLAAGVAAAAYIAWREGRGRASPLRRAGDALVLLAGPLLAVGFWLAVAWPPVRQAISALTGTGTAVSRLELWQHGLDLAGDYPFTGAGLGSIGMVHSTYVKLLNSPEITHLHNLFLEITVDQGIPGLVAFLSLLGLALWALARAVLAAAGDAPSSRRVGGASWMGRPLRMAAGASLAACVVHGMTDVGVYTSLLTPLLLLPAGFCLGLGSAAPARPATGRHRLPPWALAALAAAGLILLSLPAVRAAFLANLGAVAQTRLELGIYRRPEWRVQDGVRREYRAQLEPALARYRAALALDPGNVAASRRLAQVDLSLGDYEEARSLLERAYARAPGQRATRQLLGESYAVGGDTERGAQLWRTVDTSQGQLGLRHEWYKSIGDKQRAEWVGKAAALAGAR